MRMLPFLLFAPAMLMLAGCDGRQAEASDEIAEVSGAAVSEIAVLDMAQRISESDVTLVDVRTAEEYAEGHIAGAINMPVDSFDPAALDGRDVLLYCRSDRRSGIAATRLAAHRGETAEHLDGGILAWQDAGLPVTAPQPL